MAIGGPAAKLEQLRFEARSNGREWLGSVLQDIKRDELRELARAAGLRVKREDNVWMSVGELRAALLEHLAPERADQKNLLDVGKCMAEHVFIV